MKIDVLSESEKSASLKISGALDLDAAEALHEALARRAHVALTLDLAEASECDLTALQIFVAAVRSARENQTSFSIASHSEAVEAACAAVGLTSGDLNLV
jgi:anti-anti-sigma factor